MAERLAFKSQQSFLEKISMGATGTRRVFADLASQGHDPLELERGSRSFKIWKQVKIKRIRVPDILCVDCATRIESRAKRSLEISMSHSLSDPERGWDNGLRDNDFVALVVCERSGNRPVDWQADTLVQYVSVRDMRGARDAGQALLMRPKGAEEGFEQRINWPAAVASASGTVVDVSRDRLQYRRLRDNRIISLRLRAKGITLSPLVQPCDQIVRNQVLAAVVPVRRRFTCSKTTSARYYIDQLSSLELSERYAAAKALQRFRSPEAVDALAQEIANRSEHLYVRLEAAASLAQQGDRLGWDLINQCLAHPYLQNRLEAVIVLGEIQSDISRQMLADVLLDRSQHPEIRAAAAWALGELRDKVALAALIQSFTAVDEVIRVEAARALAKLALGSTPELIQELATSSPNVRPGVAWALAEAGQFSVQDVLGALVDDDTRRWVSYIVGVQPPDRYVHEIEQLRKRDPEVYFAVTVLWKIMSSWIYRLEEY